MTASKAKKPARPTSKHTKANGKPEHAGRGRPTIYTAELGAEICELTAMRVPLIRICEIPGMPSERTVYTWKRLHPDFLHEYARAREHRADARSDRIDAICEDLRAGKIDPNTARVLADCEKWQAGREKPAVYGDRVETRVTGAGGGPLQIEAAAAVRALLDALPDLGVLSLNGPALTAIASNTEPEAKRALVEGGQP
jgi:hypothetical protein